MCFYVVITDENSVYKRKYKFFEGAQFSVIEEQHVRTHKILYLLFAYYYT